MLQNNTNNSAKRAPIASIVTASGEVAHSKSPFCFGRRTRVDVATSTTAAVATAKLSQNTTPFAEVDESAE